MQPILRVNREQPLGPWVWALIAYALAARCAIALVLPPWQGPDEPRHFEYVRILLDKRHELWAERRLVRMDDQFPELQHEIIASMGAHNFWAYINSPDPPVLPSSFVEIWGGGSTQLKQQYSPYHWLLAAALLPFEGHGLEAQLLVTRLVSAMLSGLTVGVAWLAARLLVSDDWFVAAVASTIVATLPMHVFMGGVVNTDNAVTVLGGLVLWALARGMGRGFDLRRWTIIVLALALAVAAKRSALGLIPAISLAAMPHVRLPRTFRARLLAVGMAIVGVIGFSAAFSELPPLDWVRPAWRYYFLNEPDQAIRLLDGRLTSETAQQLLPIYVAELHRSFWGVLGWYSVQFRQTLYDILTLVSIVCGLGLLVRAARWLEAGSQTPRQLLYAMVCPAAAAALIAMAMLERLSYLDTHGFPVGRYLFVVIAPIAILLAVGLRSFLPVAWVGTRRPVLVVTVLLIALDVFVLFDSLLPAYVWRTFV